MDTRFFITGVYLPSGCRTLEQNLAAVVRPYVDHVLSYDAMLRLADLVRKEHDTLVAQNKRLRPVSIGVDLDGGSYNYRYFHIGQVSVQFRPVKGEII